jgi:hypothetical protein
MAATAADGDLADDPTPDPPRVHVRGVLDDADELVAGHASELRIPATELEVSAADAGRLDADQAFIDWCGLVALLEGQSAGAFEDERAHGTSSLGRRASHVLGPRSLRSLPDVEFDAVPLAQIVEALAIHGALVEEVFLPRLVLDESESFVGP